MSAEHTPTPWAYRTKEYDDWGTIRSTDSEGALVAVAKGSPWFTSEDFALFRESGFDPAAANAAFIVRAVNSHKALVAALIDARANLSPEVLKDPCDRLPEAIDAALKLARAS